MTNEKREELKVKLTDYKAIDFGNLLEVDFYNTILFEGYKGVNEYTNEELLEFEKEQNEE